MNETLDLLLNHSSVRKFKNDPVSKEVIDLIISASQMAPTSSNFQEYTIIEARADDKRKAIFEASGGQKWTLSAPVVLLFCGDLHRGKKYFSGNEDKSVFSNTESFIVATVDAALAAQKAFIAAQSLGLGGVFVGGIRNDMDKIADAFALPDFVYPIFAICLGYPDENNGLKPRLPKKVIYKIDTYNSENDEELINDYDETSYDYYYERTNGENPETWTERSGKMIAAKPRYEVGIFLRKKGLLKK